MKAPWIALILLLTSHAAFGQTCVVDTCTTCGVPAAGADADADTVPDLLEHNLANKFFPSLKLQHFNVDLNEAYPYLNRPIPFTVHPVPINGTCNEVNKCLELRFGLAYRLDHGDDFFHFIDNGHLGDSEFYAAVVIRSTDWATASNNTGYWSLIRDFTAAHWGTGGDSSILGTYGDRGCEQWSSDATTCRAHSGRCEYWGSNGCFGTPIDPKYFSCEIISSSAQCYVAGCTWLSPLCANRGVVQYSTTRLAGPPILYVSEGKHGTYHTDGECEAGGLYQDACPNNQYDLRPYAVAGRLQNIGNASCTNAFDRTIQHPNFCALYDVWGGAKFAESTPYKTNFTYVFDWVLPGAAQKTPAPVMPATCPGGGGGATGNPFTYPSARDQYLACYGIAGRISSNCRDISDFNDKQMCYGMSDSTQTPCTQMTDRNLQLACYGMSVAPSYPSNCRDITDLNLQRFCYGVAGRDTSQCATVADPNTRQLCYAMATSNSSYCGSITRANDRQFCYGVSSHVNSYCSSIQ
jgi:hypothetical protein